MGQVSEPPGHLKHESMTSATALRSLVEPPDRAPSGFPQSFLAIRSRSMFFFTKLTDLEALALV